MFKVIFLYFFALLLPLQNFAQEPPKENPQSEYVFPVFPEENSPQAQSADRFFTEFFNMLATLGLIIVLILFAAWFLKRMVNTRMIQANETSPIKILGRRGLTPKTAIYLLEINGKQIAIAESNAGVTALGEVPGIFEEPSPEQPSAFGKIYDDKMKGQNK